MEGNILHGYLTDNGQLDNGRIIIDTKMWSTYNPDQTPNLEAFDKPHVDLQSKEDEFLSFPPNNLPYNVSGYREIQAIRRNIQRHMSRRQGPQDTLAKSMTSIHAESPTTLILPRPD